VKIAHPIVNDESNIKLVTCGPRHRPGHPVHWRHEGALRSFLFKLPTLEYLEVDELIQLVVWRAGISPAQAAHAVSAMVGYLTARLPSSVVGRIHEQLREVQNAHAENVSDGGVE